MQSFVRTTLIAASHLDASQLMQYNTQIELLHFAVRCHPGTQCSWRSSAGSMWPPRASIMAMATNCKDHEMLAFASLAETTAPAAVSIGIPRKLQTLLASVFKPGAAASQYFFFCTWLGSAAFACMTHRTAELTLAPCLAYRMLACTVLCGWRRTATPQAKWHVTRSSRNAPRTVQDSPVDAAAQIKAGEAAP
jgi:hypothetical protein